MAKIKKTIAIVHPEIKGGGGEAVLAWTLEALKMDYRLNVITMDKIEVSFFNDFYGTNLLQDDFSFSRIYPHLERFPQKLYLFKRHLVMRYCKTVSKEYDLFFSTQNEMDFGIKGVQYIHFPVHADNLMNELNQLPNHWFYQDSYPRNLYKRACINLSSFNEAGIKQNLTLANSNWTGNQVKNIYNVQSKTVYPPVLFDSPIIPWDRRENGFVCVGRIIQEKEIEKIINILSEVRVRIPDIHLHIIGPIWDKDYASKILRLCELNQEWLFFEGAVNRSKLVKLITSHRFAIHGMEHEHFGIVVAETAKAGCIVFVPNGGGQREIIDFDERVIYSKKEDAVEKIVKILRDRRSQEAISLEMTLHGARFSPRIFMNRIRSLINNIL